MSVSELSRRMLARGCAVLGLLAAACSPAPIRPVAVPPAVPAAVASPILPAPARPPAAAVTTPPRAAPPIIETPVRKLDPAMNVYFAPGSAEVPGAADATIGNLAARLKGDRRLKVRLFAYTDDLGSKEFCIAMAMQRAKAVTAELLKRGVPPAQVRRRVVGCEVSPQSVCRSESCRQQRRRVEFRFAG